MSQPHDPPEAITPTGPPTGGADMSGYVSEGNATPDAEPWPMEDPARAAAREARLEELRQLYPNQRVAIRDEWDGTQLVEPFVIAVSDDYAVIHSAIQSLPEEQRTRCMVQFLMPPNWAKITPLWIVRDENANVRPLRRPSE